MTSDEEVHFVFGTRLLLALAYVAFSTWQGKNTGVVLADPKVDAMIAKIDLARLKAYRNAILHPTHVDDPRTRPAKDDARAHELVAPVWEALLAMSSFFFARNLVAQAMPDESAQNSV